MDQDGTEEMSKPVGQATSADKKRGIAQVDQSAQASEAKVGRTSPAPAPAPEDGAQAPSNAAAAVRMSDRERRPSIPFTFAIGVPPKNPRRKRRPKPALVEGSMARKRSLRTPNIIQAGKVLLPFLLRNFPSQAQLSDDDKAAAERNYAALYEKGLTSAILPILGPDGVARLTRLGSLRNAFEWTNAQLQCAKALNLSLEKINGESCWICGLEMTPRDREPEPGDRTNGTLATGLQCEHKLPVVLALLITGLYDSALADAIQNVAYVRELRKEYAWAHERCNQAKGETTYVKDVGEGDAVVLEINKDNVTDNLKKIWNEKYGHFIPRRTKFKERAVALLGADAELENDGEAEWTPIASASIETGLAPILTQVNGSGITKSRLYTYFTRAVVLRSKVAYGVLARPRAGPFSRLNAGVRSRILAQFNRSVPKGGRRTYRKRMRKATHRNPQRGGGEDEDADALVEAMMDCVRESLAFRIESKLQTMMMTGAPGEVILDAVEVLYSDFEDAVLDIADAVLSLDVEEESDIDTASLEEIDALTEAYVNQRGARAPEAASAAAAAYVAVADDEEVDDAGLGATSAAAAANEMSDEDGAKKEEDTVGRASPKSPPTVVTQEEMTQALDEESDADTQYAPVAVETLILQSPRASQATRQAACLRARITARASSSASWWTIRTPGSSSALCSTSTLQRIGCR
jgi:hypothetical protein